MIKEYTVNMIKTRINQEKNEGITHAYAHLLVDMYLAVFAPAFTFSLCESEAPANRRCA